MGEYIKVGDYVDYEPTKIDKDKTQNVDASKLTYTSPIGGYDSNKGIITNGNGNSEQTFTAKMNDGTDDGIKWRVLSISKDVVQLISEKSIQTDENIDFYLKAGIGYLYAEQELNSICSIYGYGYGADTNIETNYTIGGLGDSQTNKIENSGARSITIDDINKKAGIKETDFSRLDSNYGTATNPTTTVYYPTLNSNNTTEPGRSAGKTLKIMYNYYAYRASEISNSDIVDMLFSDSYWLSSRCIKTNSIAANYLVYSTSTTMGVTCDANFCTGNSSRLSGSTPFYHKIRPVVTLKRNTIDISNKTDNTGTAENPWKLK